jgi:uncharacterized membrane protein YsdA (DUF1294 family)
MGETSMIIYYYLLITILTFLVWGFDKLRAIQHKWRVPERSLITLIMVGGAFGALAGMLLFRHKTRKLMFKIWIGLGCVIHGLILAYFG